MEPSTKTRDPDIKLKAFPLPNGAVKKPHQPVAAAAAAAAEEVLYRECLKNYAASLGGHALDGCGEFMPSPASNPADPTSLKCAACGCHRNFHRRVAGHHRTTAAAVSADDGLEGEGERDGREDGGEEDADLDEAFEATARRRSSSSPPPPPYFSSAPHMLLALSSGVRSEPPIAGPGKSFTSPVPVASVAPPRKRFRTKFSPEQKERMLELSERLGWRLQKRDEGLVEEYCKGIGVGRGVFKVWMHNNKHHLFGPSTSRRGEGRSAFAAAVASGAGRRAAEVNGGSIDSGNANGNVNGHAMNGSSSSC